MITVFSARAKSSRSSGVRSGSDGAGRSGATHTSYGYLAQTGTNATTSRAAIDHAPRVIVQLLLQQVGQQPATGGVVVRLLLRQLARGDRRHERIRVDLPVRVVQRHADLDAAVFEREHILTSSRAPSALVRSAQTSTMSAR